FTPGDWPFEVVFDYGEHTASPPTPAEDATWSVRPDPFSSFRSGFDIRCYRLCRRVLMFHRFPALGEDPVLVRATELTYSESTSLTKLVGVRHRGYRTDGSTVDLALPPVQFTYSEAVIGQE